MSINPRKNVGRQRTGIPDICYILIRSVGGCIMYVKMGGRVDSNHIYIYYNIIIVSSKSSKMIGWCSYYESDNPNQNKKKCFGRQLSGKKNVVFWTISFI